MDKEWMSLAARAERVEQAAWRDFFAAAPPDLMPGLRARAVDLDDALALVAPGAATSLYNRVLGVGVDRPADDPTIKSIQQLYTASDTRYAIHAAPVAAPARGPEWWEARGFRPHSLVAKLVRNTDPVEGARTALRVVRAEPQNADVVADLIAAAWPDPPTPGLWTAATVGRHGWRHYLALDGDSPVATAALFIAGAGAWLGWAVTLPDHRRQGAHSALVAQRLADARDLGCSMVTAATGLDGPHASAPSHRTMIRIGFTLLYVRPALSPSQTSTAKGSSVRAARLSESRSATGTPRPNMIKASYEHPPGSHTLRVRRPGDPDGST